MPLGLLLAISLAAGTVGAMAGMGGGVVLIPALTLLGMDIKHAIAVSIVSVIATSSGAASAYLRDRITNLRVGMFLEMFTIVGAMAGARLTIAAPLRVLFFSFGAVLLTTWLVLFLRRGEQWTPARHVDAFSRWLSLGGEYRDAADGRVIAYQGARAYLAAPLMFLAGGVAGLLGIGAGALKVLIHDVVMGLPPKVSTTTSNLIIGVTALAGTGVYLGAGLIDPGVAAPVILGVSAGSFLGTRVLVRLTNRAVRRFFLVVLLVLGAEMMWRGFRGA